MLSLWGVGSREFMNIIERRTKISITYIDYPIKVYLSAINTETKAECGFQIRLNTEEQSALSPLNVQIFLALIIEIIFLGLMGDQTLYLFYLITLFI